MDEIRKLGMNIKSKFLQIFNRIKSVPGLIATKFPAATRLIITLGKSFSVFFLFIVVIFLYSTWHSGQVLWMARHEHLSNLNYSLTDYRNLWDELSGKTSPDPSSPAVTAGPLIEHVNTRHILFDFSKDYLYLDFSISISKDSKFAKNIVQGIYYDVNENILGPYFGKITWGDQETIFQFEAITWDVDSKNNELVIHLRQKFPYTNNFHFIQVDLSAKPNPDNDVFTIRLADGFRLTQIEPFPNQATPTDIEILGSDRQRLESVSFHVVGNAAIISIAGDNEWRPLISKFINSFDSFKNIPFIGIVYRIYYVFPLLVFLFWARQNKQMKVTEHMLAVTQILLIFYFCIVLFNEINGYSVGSVDSLLDFPAWLLPVLFWNTEFWRLLPYPAILGFSLSVYRLTPIFLGIIVSTILLGRTGGFAIPNLQILKRLKLYWHWFAITFLTIPLIFGIARASFAGFVSAGDLVLIIMWSISVILFFCVFGICYLLERKPNWDTPLLFVFIVSYGFVSDIFLFGNIGDNISTTIHNVILYPVSRLWDKVSLYVYLFLFVYALLSMVIFAISETNWKINSVLHRHLKLRLIISSLLTILFVVMYSFGFSFSGDIQNRPYPDLAGDLAITLINSIPYVWSFLILIYLSLLGSNTSRIEGEIRLMGILASSAVILAPPSGSMPIKFILGAFFLFYISRRPEHWWLEAENSHHKYFDNPDTWIDRAVNFIQIEKAFKEFRKKHYEKLVDNSVNARKYEKDILTRKKEVQTLLAGEFDGKAPRDIIFSFGPYQSAFENAWYGAKWSVLFAIPWMILFFPDLVSSWGVPYGSLGDTLWNVVSNSLQMVFEWAVYGFLFGYFYCYWRGNNGLTKAFWFFGALITPYFVTTGLEILGNISQIGFGISSWASILFWPLELLLHCLLLGVVAFEYLPLRKHQHDFQTLLDINGMANLGISISSIVLTFASAIIGFLTTQTVELLKYSLFGGK